MEVWMIGNKEKRILDQENEGHQINREYKDRTEVVGMILTSFDQEEYEKTIRDESYREGVEKGVEQGMQLGQTGLVVNMLKNGLSPDEIKKYTNASDEVIRQAKESLEQ